MHFCGKWCAKLFSQRFGTNWISRCRWVLFAAVSEQTFEFVTYMCESVHQHHGIGTAIQRHVVEHYQYDTSDVRRQNRVVGAWLWCPHKSLGCYRVLPECRCVLRFFQLLIQFNTLFKTQSWSILTIAHISHSIKQKLETYITHNYWYITWLA